MNNYIILDHKKIYRSRWYGEAGEEGYKRALLNNIYYCGVPIINLPHAAFVLEYLSNNNVKLDDTSYYWFRKETVEKDPNYPLIYDDCEWYKKLILDLEQNGQLDAVEVIKITDNIYEVSDGTHRASYLAVKNIPIKVKVIWGLDCEWDLPEEEINKAIELYSNTYSYFKENRIAYLPVWWKDKKWKEDIEVPPIRYVRPDSVERLYAIIDDLYLLKKPRINVLDIGCNTGFFSSYISQIEGFSVIGIENNAGWFKLLELQKEHSGYPNNILFGTINDVEEETDASIYLHTFHNTIEFNGLDEAKKQFAKICELTKHKIYFCLGAYSQLNENNTLTHFQNMFLKNYGFNVRLLYYSGRGSARYRTPIYVAEK